MANKNGSGFLWSTVCPSRCTAFSSNIIEHFQIRGTVCTGVRSRTLQTTKSDIEKSFKFFQQNNELHNFWTQLAFFHIFSDALGRSLTKSELNLQCRGAGESFWWVFAVGKLQPLKVSCFCCRPHSVNSEYHTSMFTNFQTVQTICFSRNIGLIIQRPRSRRWCWTPMPHPSISSRDPSAWATLYGEAWDIFLRGMQGGYI